jgi:hypothetical protein
VRTRAAYHAEIYHTIQSSSQVLIIVHQNTLLHYFLDRFSAPFVASKRCLTKNVFTLRKVVFCHIKTMRKDCFAKTSQREINFPMLKTAKPKIKIIGSILISLK